MVRVAPLDIVSKEQASYCSSKLVGSLSQQQPGVQVNGLGSIDFVRVSVGFIRISKPLEIGL